MEKMPTAKEILNDKVYITDDGIEDVHDSLSTVADVMIEFAKLHVEAALKEASEKALVEDEYGDTSECMGYDDGINKYSFKTNKDSILNSYPLENIK